MRRLLIFSGRTVSGVSKLNKLQKWDCCSISNSTNSLVGLLMCSLRIFPLGEQFVQDSSLFL